MTHDEASTLTAAYERECADFADEAPAIPKPMSRFMFSAVCGEYNIAPCFALEIPRVRLAIQMNNEMALRMALEDEF